MKFLYYYLRSMRLYYCCVTGSATLAGIVVATGKRGMQWDWRTGIVLLIGFFAWGVNQIINDFCDRREDRINAPHRPMVTGRLPAKPALLMSVAIMMIFGIVSCLITPWTLLPVGTGFLFNLLYGVTKGIPLLGNAFYALSISMCTLYGFVGSIGGVHDRRDFFVVLNVCGFLALSHFLMCLYSTLKDVPGDRAAGKETLAVVLGSQRTKYISHLFAAVLLGLYLCPVFLTPAFPAVFLIAWEWCFLLAAWNGALLTKNQMHRATKANCQSCAAQQLLILSLYTPWGPVVMFAVWGIVEMIFRWYPDEKE